MSSFLNGKRQQQRRVIAHFPRSVRRDSELRQRQDQIRDAAHDGLLGHDRHRQPHVGSGECELEERRRQRQHDDDNTGVARADAFGKLWPVGLGREQFERPQRTVQLASSRFKIMDARGHGRGFRGPEKSQHESDESFR